MQRMALVCLLLAGGISFLWSSYVVIASSSGLVDFRAYYYGARCLLEHRDPYQKAVLLDVYRNEGGAFPSAPERAHSIRQAISVCINLPTSLLLISPLALLPWRVAAVFWMLLEFAGLICAGYLGWDLTRSVAGESARGISLAVICFVLANCELTFDSGNLAGIVIALCVTALWCFFKERFIPAGSLCLAVSLVLKPHDVGFIWLLLFLSGGGLRRPARLSLILAGLLCVPAVLWTSHQAPHWVPELGSNLQSTSARGEINDPGPTSLSAYTSGSILDLQTVISVFRDDPHIYNPLSFFVCGALLLTTFVALLRSQVCKRRAWLALAAIVPLSMLLTYHRAYDAKLLLLTLPACMMLWVERRRAGRLALLLTILGVVLTGDLPLAIFSTLTRNVVRVPQGALPLLLSIVLLHPATLALLIIGFFYLCMLMQSAPRTNRSSELLYEVSAEAIS